MAAQQPKQVQGNQWAGPTGKRNNGKRNNSNPSWLLKGTGKLLSLVTSTDLVASSAAVSSTAEFELLCTYNWALLASPTIFVPGEPSKWKPLELPVTLPRDSGSHFIDQNVSRAPTYPFEPIFKALSVMNPSVNFRSVDVVTNRNSLRNLLAFCQGRGLKTFRIDLNIVGNTLFLTRREKNARQIIYGMNNSGFGHNFENAFTESDPEFSSSSHHRIIRYALGDLNCVVRFEVDAYCDEDDNSAAIEATVPSLEVEDDDILNSLENLSLSGIKDKNTPYEEGMQQEKGPSVDKRGTTVIDKGRVIPCSRIMEIKTKHQAPSMSQTLPQLWFGRTPHLTIARHDNGTFKEIRRIDAKAQFLDWEATQQQNLCKMVQLISELKEITKATGGACVVVCEHKVRPLKLQVLESNIRKDVLPKHLVEKYWRDETQAQAGGSV